MAQFRQGTRLPGLKVAQKMFELLVVLVCHCRILRLFPFVWLQLLAQFFESVAIARSNGIQRNAGQISDFLERPAAPDAEHEHFALFCGQSGQRALQSKRAFHISAVMLEENSMAARREIMSNLALT